LRSSPEVLFPFSVTQPYRDAWSLPRPRLSRFDVPCHNINQPSLIVPGKLSLRFYFFASRTIRFIRPSRELSHPGDAHGIWSFAVLFLPTGQLLFPVTMAHMPLMTCHPRFIFVEEPTAISFYATNWVARRSVTARLIRLLGFSLPTVRAVVASQPPWSILPWT